MRIPYRQGLVSAQPDFLQISTLDSRYIDVVVSPTPVVATAAFMQFNYLIGEARTVTHAWGPFSTSDTQYLYWDINLATGLLTRGATVLAPLTMASSPADPGVNQTWYDTSESVMKVWNGTRWQNTIRVFAGSLVSGASLIAEPFASQVGDDTQVDAGYILTDGLGNAFKGRNGEFLTTETGITSVDTGSVVKVEGAQIIVQANENIPKFSLVYLVNGRAALASGIPPENEAKTPMGMVTADAYQNDAVNVVPGGRVVVNEQWNWLPLQWGKAIYCDATGGVTLFKPPAYKNIRAGTIVGKNSVLLSFDWETEVPPASAGLSGVNAQVPLQTIGSPDFPTIRIPQATVSLDGYMSANDFARIPALEALMITKANVGHGHAMGDVSGLALALSLKSDVGHTHAIADVLLLQDALDGKAPVVHTHVMADVSDLGPVITDIYSNINAKVSKVVGAVGDNFASLTLTGNIQDSGVSAASFSLVGHLHLIDQVSGLQLALDGKAPTIHVHAIADTTGLQDALDNKSDVTHTHALDDLSDVDVASYGAFTGQVLTYNSTLSIWKPASLPQVLLSGLGDASINTPVASNFLAFSGMQWVNRDIVIADVTGLQGALDGKAEAIHTHVIGDVTGLQLSLNSKAPLSHTHAIADVADLQSTLNGKSDVGHMHVITDVAGLTLALSNKSDVGHVHIIADTTGLQDALDGKAALSHTHALSSLSDVNLTVAPVTDNVLKFNGTAWVAGTVAGGGGGSFVPSLETVVF
jgi:hypothetical protein